MFAGDDVGGRYWPPTFPSARGVPIYTGAIYGGGIYRRTEDGGEVADEDGDAADEREGHGELRPAAGEVRRRHLFFSHDLGHRRRHVHRAGTGVPVLKTTASPRRSF